MPTTARKKESLKIIKSSITVALIVLLDQSTKFIFYKQLFPEESIDIIRNVFSITLVYNTGIAFGLFKGSTGIFIYTSIIAAGYLSYLLFAKKSLLSNSYARTQYALALILGGAIGNLIDRLRFGFVIDFLDFKVWPVFNIADSAITIGTVFLLILLILRRD